MSLSIHRVTARQQVFFQKTVCDESLERQLHFRNRLRIGWPVEPHVIDTPCRLCRIHAAADVVQNLLLQTGQYTSHVRARSELHDVL